LQYFGTRHLDESSLYRGSEDELVEEEEFHSDAYSDADAREEMIESGNDSIDTLVNDSQDASTEGIDNGGWNHDH
jgi:N utilization substance protein A